MIIMVTGGRNYDDYIEVRRVLELYAEVGNVLLSGGAEGADYLAERFWHSKQLPYVVVPAEWNHLGKAAGVARSTAMLKGLPLAAHEYLLKPGVLIAFPGGKGTAHTIKAAQHLNIPVVYAEGE